MARAKRTYNTRLIRSTVSYSIFEIAALFSIHKATVRSWFKQGLKRIDDQRPYLVRGSDLREFLDRKQKKRKRRCQPDELYCCRCREPRQPRDKAVTCRTINRKTGRLSGLCEVCSSRVNKVVSLKNLSKLKEILTITTTGKADLIVLDSPNVNTDFEEGISA